MRFLRQSLCLLLPAVVAVSLEAQEPSRAPATDSARSPGLGIRGRLWADSLTLETPPALLASSRLPAPRRAARLVAEVESRSVREALGALRAARWGLSARAPGEEDFGLRADAPVRGAEPVVPAPDPARTDSLTRPATAGSALADLGLQLNTRIEAKGERNRNERCTSNDLLSPLSNCAGSLQPQLDFQFDLRTGGVVADRIHVDVDYDSEREFDASNNISVHYEGKPDEILHRLEVGNVSFAPPTSRFLTAGIPSGNYGLQAVGQIGPMRFRSIIAQQKGNVVKDRVFTIGDRTLQTVERQTEDFAIERRRFFWVIDPRLAFPGRYPNVDILDRNLEALATLIPPGERPRRVLVYRYRPPQLSGSAARDINGPYAVTRYARNSNEIGPFEVLQEGVDYYIDPSNLWIALVNPVQRGDRVAVSYTVSDASGAEVVVGAVGGTFPTSRGPPGRDTLNLLWDSEVLPGDVAFNREIRSVYRLGGEEIDRSTVSVKIVAGSGEQERPQGVSVETFLQMFGLAQPSNSSAFDIENRLWPRPSDPNVARTAGPVNARLIRDYFIVFPSLTPFADSGLADPPNPLNDSLYRTPDEDLVSTRRPPTQYRLLTRYAAMGGGDFGSLALGSVQVRPNSERIQIDGLTLARELDYRVDYELGRLVFSRPDTLFSRPRRVTVQYEENPLFAAAPTAVFGVATEFPMESGLLSLTAISQRQATTFNRPPLGFEPASSFVAGVTGQWSFASEALTRALARLPFVRATQPSRVGIQAEFATSRPQSNSAGVAYVETFEGEGGLTINLNENVWRMGSRPFVPPGGIALGGRAFDFAIDSAAALAWQNVGLARNPATGRLEPLYYYTQTIDSGFVFAGGQAFRSPETLLWETLHASGREGLIGDVGGVRQHRWTRDPRPGRRWRSITQSLSPSGVDLTRVEQLELWALVDTLERARNPAFLFDFGDISENTIAFQPETLTVSGPDSLYRGRRPAGFDRMDTERDPVTRSFDASRNDVGLPGDRADTLVGPGGGILTGLALCGGGQARTMLGDPAQNCTVGNRRLDEEDLDLDGVLNMRGPENRDERLLRYVVDLSDRSVVHRTGQCFASPVDPASVSAGGRYCWVNVRIPFSAPQRINDPLLRRIKALRLTIVSGVGASPEDSVLVPIARLKLLGAPWVKRTETPVAGIAGALERGAGFVIATVIGTQDRNATNGLTYQSPPGIADLPDDKTGEFSPGQILVNEKSLRILSSALSPRDRAEAYYRFPEGEKNFMGYRRLHVWARGRGPGWGPQGDLQFYLRIGRDVDNFYLYRAPVNEGATRAAWLPEQVIEFDRFYRLRAKLQNAFLQRSADSIACTGIDAELIAASAPPQAPGSKRYAACADGYIVYSADPGLSPPNLAAVQELAVGIVRVADGGGVSPILPSDTLELWVDDVRLMGVVNDPGYAGQLGLSLAAADIGTINLNLSRRDNNFRQLAEQPTYVTDDQIHLTSSFYLDRLLPAAIGLSLPLSVNHSSTGSDPFFLARSDLPGSELPGLRTPKSGATTYSLAARRVTPLGGLVGLIVDHLSLSSAYTAASQRSEYQTGRASAFSGSLDYSLAGAARERRIPRWLDRTLEGLPSWLRDLHLVRSIRTSALRWNPSQVRLTSGYAHNTDRRSSFSLPIAAERDTAREVTGLRRDWRNRGLVELRPFEALLARIDLTSIRDLRDYGDSTDVGVVSGFERARLLGMDAGLERERQMSSALSWTVPLAGWVRPRLDWGSSFSLFRDPNTRSLLADPESGERRLPQRLANSRLLTVGAAVDLAAALGRVARDSGVAERIARVFQPVRVNWSRELRSMFDATAVAPDMSYQLGFGGIDDFRQRGGVLATSAGLAHAVSVDNTLTLPLGASIVHHFARTTSTTWTRRSLSAQSQLEARSVTWPDVALRWTYRPPWLAGVVGSIGAEARSVVTRAATFQPIESLAGSVEGVRTEVDIRQYPLRGTIAWDLWGGFTTTAAWTRSTRSELRSGGRTRGEVTDLTADAGKVFKVPQRLNLPGDMVRGFLGYQRSAASTFFLADTVRKRISDTGRWSLNARAESDVAQNATFSLQLSRTVTFDAVNDRRFAQMVMSAVLQLQFVTGELR